MNSFRSVTGSLLLTSSTLGTVASTVTGTHLVGSKGSDLYKWWLIAMGPGGDTRKVVPSASARATNSAPMLPPAPTLFSTSTPAGYAARNFSVRIRGSTSAVPPAGNGTTNLTGLVG